MRQVSDLYEGATNFMRCNVRKKQEVPVTPTLQLRPMSKFISDIIMDVLGKRLYHQRTCLYIWVCLGEKYLTDLCDVNWERPGW